MSVWRLEWLRVWRTRRLIVLLGTFLILGLGSPVLTYYLPDIVKHSASDGVQIVVPKQTAIDGIQSYAGNLDQLGTLIVVVVAAGTLCLDAHPILAAFYRTRQHGPRLLLGRYATLTAAVVGTLALGTLGAWYETAVLLGSLQATDVLGGFLLEALWFGFVTAVVAAAASLVRGVSGAIGAAVALLLAIAVLPALKSWLPTRLADGVALLAQRQDELWRPVLVTAAATFLLLALATDRFARREQ